MTVPGAGVLMSAELLSAWARAIKSSRHQKRHYLALVLGALQVLDSPFSRLTDLMLEIVVSQRLPIPKVRTTDSARWGNVCMQDACRQA
jgi:hypothetical protein